MGTRANLSLLGQSPAFPGGRSWVLVDPAKIGESHAATIDYVIASTAGWMMGTFGGALEARQIDASHGKLRANVTGEVEAEDGVLVIRRIHIEMQLAASPEFRETVDRVHGIYAMNRLCTAHWTGLSNSLRLVR